MVGTHSATLAAPRLPFVAAPRDGEDRDLAFRAAAFLCAGSSVWTLLAPMFGLLSAPRFAVTVYVPMTVAMFLLPHFARKRGLHRFVRLFWWSLLAGVIATAVYDIVRLPLWFQKYPFGAITKMGMLVTGAAGKGFWAEVAGWAYHFTNGCGFAVMFAMALPRGKWDLAFVWSLFLEAMMVVTPYSELLGIKRSFSFLWVSLYAHVLYGLALGAALWLFRTRIHPHDRLRRGGTRVR